MPRLRGSDMLQRQSPRVPYQIRTSSSDSDRKSPRGAQSDPTSQRKLGTRIADLDTQLGQAQEELKDLKDQLASVEVAKKAAQEQLEKTKKSTFPEPEENQESKTKSKIPALEVSDDNKQEVDVVEVPNVEINEDEVKITTLSIVEPEKPSAKELAMKNEELSSLKAKLEEKEKEFQNFFRENENLKKELNVKTLEISSTKAKTEEMNLKFNGVTQELEATKNDASTINEKLEATEKEKEELENEMKKLRAQTEQWRKAADAAAAVLAGEVEMNQRRLSERCGSMDYKRYGNVFEPTVGGYGCYMGSPGLLDDSNDGFGHVKRKGSSIKKFGDLWRKKGQK